MIIYTHNQAAIKTIDNPSSKSGAYIVADIVYLVGCLQKHKQVQIEIRWVPSHRHP